ncbi:unnamed protein product [Brassica rapa]|uniref:Uncharacterized protein n=1 Tax=Brassica campestris TaxID=3711 RepID=A0A8D9I5Y2_BRACM|nr:unnamed protein product [Brassica rapa]
MELRRARREVPGEESGLHVHLWYFPGGGGFCRSAAAGSSFREESLLQFRLRRLSAIESGGYQRSALPFGIPMFFEKKV